MTNQVLGFWIALVIALGFAIVAFSDRLGKYIGLDTWERVSFDWDNYGHLRDSGLTHKETIQELERLWNQRDHQ